MPVFVNHNGTIYQNNETILMADNKSYRYGYGLFETMKLINGKIILEELHFERFFSSLALMKITLPESCTAAKFHTEIVELCKKNLCEPRARIRLSVYPGNGGLYDENKNSFYLIETWPLEETVNRLNVNGLLIDVFDDAKKSCDTFSNLKSANYLPYAMAALHAKKNNLNDCLVLNTNNRVCDSTISNIFFIKDGTIFTPPLTEGCVNGVMRRYLVKKLQSDGPRLQATSNKLQEVPLTITHVEDADEVFLTNAIYGIRWVKRFRNKSYSSVLTVSLYDQLIAPLFS